MDVLHPSGLCSCSYRLSLRALEVYWRQRSDSLKTQGRAHTCTSTHTCAQHTHTHQHIQHSHVCSTHGHTHPRVHTGVASTPAFVIFASGFHTVETILG